MVNNVQFLGSKTNCTIAGLNDKNLEFYRSFVYEGITYNTNEFVLIRHNHFLKVGHLLSLYYSREYKNGTSPYRGTIQWYIFAKNVNSLVNANDIELNKVNEVVQYTSEHNVCLEDIKSKCCVVLGTVDDSNTCINKTHFGSESTYFCRYKIDKHQLAPLISIPNKKPNNSNKLLYSILDLEDCDNVMVVVTSDDEDENKPQKRISKRFSRNKSTNSNSYVGSEDPESDVNETNIDKVRSPINSSKVLKLSSNNNYSLKSSRDSTPRKKYKNGIANISPPPYTIIKPVNLDDSDLKMKLKVMEYFRPVKVYPTKLDDDITELKCVKVDNIMERSNCILLSPKNNMKLYETPTKNSTQTRSLYRSSKCTPRYTPQRRSTRISSLTKCSYVENNDSIIFDEIEEENLVESVNNISLENTPSKKVRKAARTINCSTPKVQRSTTKSSLNMKDSSKLSNKPDEVVRRSSRSTRGVTRYSSIYGNETDASVSKSKTHCDETPKTPSRTITLSNKLDSVKMKLKYDSDSDMEVGPQTPKQNLKIRNTPSARAKLIREGVITPSVPSRNKAVVKDNTPLAKARTQLHVSYLPTALPCRENEFNHVGNFLKGKLFESSGGCIYVSGVPGTGKTATITEVIKELKSLTNNGDLPNFTYVNVNCMRLSEPRQAYVEIYKQLTGRTVGWEQAQSMLEDKFVGYSKAKTLPILLVIDELDILCNKRQDVVYNLLDWPIKAKLPLIVVAIANTMDLPERLLIGRVTSRLGLTRLTFQPYTHKQLQEIVTKRVLETNTFNPDAIQLVARKVASVSGDARRALDICRRAAEIAEREGAFTLVSLNHVNQALNAMITQPKVQAIKRCCALEKLVLRAIVSEVDRTGIEETTFQSVYQTLKTLATLDGFASASITIVKSALARLSACRILLVDHKSCNIFQKIILNVSSDDIHYALTS